MAAWGRSVGAWRARARGDPGPGATPRSVVTAPWPVRALAWFALGTVVAGGVAATALLRAHERGEYGDRLRDVAEQAASALAANASGVLESLRGAPALLVGDGEVTAAEFEAFAADVRRSGALEGIGYAVPVSSRDRAAWERATGITIVERGEGGLVPAATRPSYAVVVQAMSPPRASSRSIGFDLRSEPTRRATLDVAASMRGPAMGAPVTGLNTGERTYFASLAVRDPAGRVAGYLNITMGVDAIVARAKAQLPAGTSLTVRDGAEVLVRGRGPARAEARVGGRTWLVGADDGGGPDQTGSNLVAFGTVVSAGGLAMAFHRQGRYQRDVVLLSSRLDADRARAERLAELGRVAADAGHWGEVARRAAGHIRLVVGADVAEVGVVGYVACTEGQGPDERVLHVVDDGADDATGDATGDAAGEHAAAVQRLGDRAPLTDAARTDEVVVVADRAAWKQRYPALVDDAVAAGVHTAVAVPLRDARGAPLGAIAVAWRHPVDVDANLLSVLRTVADLCARTLERSMAADTQARRAGGIAALAGALSSAASPAEVARHVLRHLPACYDAVDAVVTLVTPSGVLERLPGRIGQRLVPIEERSLRSEQRVPAADCAVRGEPLLFGDRNTVLAAYPWYAEVAESIGLHALAVLPLRAGDGEVVATLTLVWRRPVTFDAALTAELTTVAELVAQTLERSHLHEAEHDLVASLQRRFLHRVPALEGFEVAARYEPASRLISIGGDWYDLRTFGHRGVLVVGDVAGHGPGAVTDMARLQTLVAGLVQAGRPLGALLHEACVMQDPAERVFATAAVVELDGSSRTLAAVLGGHPPPLLRLPDGTTRLLDAARTAPLGAQPSVVEPHRQAFPPGALLVVYTDGLVERRAEPLETGIDRLAAALVDADPTRPLPVLLDELVAAVRAPAPHSEAIDDDLVLVLVRSVA